MISILVTLIVVVVALYIVRLLLPMLGLPEPINTVVLLVLGLIALLYLFGFVGSGSTLRL